LTQRNREAVLIYGTLQKAEEKIRRSLTLPVIDVTSPTWTSELASSLSPLKAKQCIFYCTREALFVAKKKLPKENIRMIGSLSEIPVKNESSPKPLSAKTSDGIAISNEYTSKIDESRAWLTGHHLELLDALLSKGFEVEIIDENGQLIRKLGN
jgi:hypothetical protein